MLLVGSSTTTQKAEAPTCPAAVRAHSPRKRCMFGTHTTWERECLEMQGLIAKGYFKYVKIIHAFEVFSILFHQLY